MDQQDTNFSNTLSILGPPMLEWLQLSLSSLMGPINTPEKRDKDT